MIPHTWKMFMKMSRVVSGARLSAAGADDNYSATSTLLQAAPLYMNYPKKGYLNATFGCFILPEKNFLPIVWVPDNFCQALIGKEFKIEFR